MIKTKYYFILMSALLPSIASADLATETGLETAAGPTNLIKQTDVRILIAGIINSLLGFLGALFIVLVIFGGLKWMTAGGSAEKVSEARTVIKNATIGLTVVVLSYVIVRTVL